MVEAVKRLQNVRWVCDLYGVGKDGQGELKYNWDMQKQRKYVDYLLERF